MKTNLQKVRKEAGFRSAKAFAEHIGISPNTYTGYEQGKTGLTVEQAWLFADALGEAMGRHVSLDELAGRDWPRIEDRLSPAERELVNAYKSTNAQGRATIDAVVRANSGMGLERPSGMAQGGLSG